jgi:hypothetical protein
VTALVPLSKKEIKTNLEAFICSIPGSRVPALSFLLKELEESGNKANILTMIVTKRVHDRCICCTNRPKHYAS